MSECTDAPDRIEVEGLPRVGEPGHVDWYVVATWRTATKKQAEALASMLRDQMGVPHA